MDRKDRLRQMRAAAQKAALERYNSRTAERTENKKRIAEEGPGAADSQDRRERYRDRLANIDMLRTMAPIGRLPFGVERRMGPTLDIVIAPPSEVAKKAGRPVARIVTLGSRDVEPEGFATGFLIAPDLLITNRHVFSERSDANACAANFLYERTARGLERGLVFELDPKRFFVSDETLDFAIVAVAPRSTTGDRLSDLGQVSLIEATPKILKGDSVNIIQHPEGGPKQYAVSQNRLVDILDANGFLHYETDTLEGSSGSPAFSANWELVALHHAAIPQTRDGKVVARDGSFWAEEMGDDEVHWIANEGARISAIVARLSSMQLPDQAEQTILRQLLETTRDPVAEGVAALAGSEMTAGGRDGRKRSGGEDDRLSMGGSMAGIQFTFTGPVTINIAAPVAATPVQPAALLAPEKSIRFDPDYAGRKGYDPAFLGETILVPPPKVAPERMAEMLMADDGAPLVLKYHHYELAMNRVRRLQMWSAANVDYDKTRKSTKDRKEWGSDRWIPDPRIPAALQIFDADFYKPAGNIDRGHIVRREDNEWGDSELEIEYANSDTFHWTNCTPQHEAFNQSSPGRNDAVYRGMEGVWGAFENHIQQSRTGQNTKACILAGPILSPKDPSADFGRGPIQYPLRFWKVVCIADTDMGGGLKAFGFILNQKAVVDQFGIERFGAGRFERDQYSLPEIERDAGIRFDAVILKADTMAGQPPKPIGKPSDIQGL